MYIKTPIIFTLESFIQDKEDPIIPQPDPVTPENELDLVTEPIFLAPRYYLKIKAPHVIKNDALFIPSDFIYYIPWEGIYKNQVRVALPPTVGWGEGSCYEVEYWQWTPQITPLLYKKQPIKTKLIKTEHWLVPHPSNRYLLNYHHIKDTNFKTLNITLKATGNPISLIEYNDLLVITSVNKTNNYSINFIINSNTSLIQRAVNYKSIVDLQLTTNVLVDEPIIINYIKPITINDVLFKNSLFPQNIYINQTSYLQSHPI